MEEFQQFQPYLQFIKDGKGSFKVVNFYNQLDSQSQIIRQLILLHDATNYDTQQTGLYKFFNLIQQLIFKLKQIYQIYEQYSTIKSPQFIKLLDLQNYQYQKYNSECQIPFYKEGQYESSQTIEKMLEQGQVEEQQVYINEECQQDSIKNGYNGLKKIYVDYIIKEYEGLLLDSIVQSQFCKVIKNPTKIKFDLLKEIDEKVLKLEITVKQQSANESYLLIGDFYQNIMNLINVQGISHLNVEILIIDIKSDHFSKVCCMYDLYEGDREYLPPAIVYLQHFRTNYIKLYYSNQVYPFQYRKHKFQLYLEDRSSIIRCSFNFNISEFYTIEEVLDNKLIQFVNQYDEELIPKVIQNIYEYDFSQLLILCKYSLEDIDINEIMLEEIAILNILALKSQQIQRELMNNLQLLLVDLFIN